MKQLRVVHYPQVPCKPFIVDVKNLEEAKKISNTLARYDSFQYENSIKPDYASTTEVQEFDTDEKEWLSWTDEITGISDVDEYLLFIKNVAR